jgi:hypothetical protein
MIYGALLLVLLLTAIIPIIFTVILRNLGLYKNLSKRRRLIAYFVSFFLILMLLRFSAPFLSITSNGLNLLLLYIWFLLFGSFAFQNVSKTTLNRARWGIACLTFIMLLVASII